ncbi:MAG TPA: MoxR family ATPase [Acidimicrobiales bacterium]|nr:MoxR family ATPase [Acidimicrobiales bacterium]
MSQSSFVTRFDQLAGNVARVIQGKDAVVRAAITCVLAEGHLLIEDVPGVGKTTLARAIAASVSLVWNRIQFTPDLLPSDVTGVSVFDQTTATFSFRPGPVFANIVLGDEINRASPKTQSALLEVMEERTVTTDATVYQVPRPFIVVATQNPIDLEGTYTLPEAQLDRFLMRLSIGYPGPEAEAQILRAEKDRATVADLGPVMTGPELSDMIEQVKRSVEVGPAIEGYIVSICKHTRSAPEARLGVSPRGGLALLRAARVTAAASGRDFVTPDDVKALAQPTLAHRIILKPDAEVQGRTTADVVARALQGVAVPRTLLR